MIKWFLKKYKNERTSYNKRMDILLMKHPNERILIGAGIFGYKKYLLHLEGFKNEKMDCKKI